jgi:hypothetical protein
MIEIRRWGAFVVIEFTHEINSIQDELPFDDEQFGSSPGFEELRKCNTPSENLSKRRRESKIEWMDEQAGLNQYDRDTLLFLTLDTKIGRNLISR